MKVKQTIPAPQNPEPEITQIIPMANDQATISSSSNDTDNESTIPEKPTPNSNKNTPLPSYEDLDGDLAFERDELLLKPDTRQLPRGPKVWAVKDSTLTFSALEATVAVKRGLFTYDDFAIYTPSSALSSTKGPTDPITGALSAALGTVGTIAQRASDYPLLISKVLDAPHEGIAHAELEKFANDSSKGVTGIVGAGLRAPMDFTVNVSRGFHNLPKLYGDDSVREVEKVDDFGSGVLAAGKGFGLGLWDGLSGLVTQPIKGAEEGGFMGGLIGFGKGLGGAVFKPAAGAVGIPGNLFTGIYEEIQKPTRVGAEFQTREEQMLQGFREWDAATEDERKRVFEGIRRELEDLETLES